MALQQPQSQLLHHHPYAPLTVAEVQLAATACRAKALNLGLPSLRFNTITLKEPPKATYLSWSRAAGAAAAAAPPPAPPRMAFCILQTPPEFVVIEAGVDLTAAAAAGGAGRRSSEDLARCVTSWNTLEGAEMDGQPLATPDDCLEAEAIARNDPRVAELLRERGLADLGEVACDPWAIHACPPEWRGRRCMQVFMYMKSGPDDNEYAHPLDLCPVVDLNTREVIHVDAYPQPPLVPRRSANYHRDLLEKPFREGPKPLHVVQPQGPSFTVSGWHVGWQGWDLHLGFNGREGLVLYDVGYNDPDQEGRRRPILHRASIVEMCVPYADPRSPYNRKCAFDAGDYGLGFAANSLKLGCDCLGYIHYWDGVVNDAKGDAVVIENAICMHEEDVGLLWKHLDYRTGYAESRRARRLVISFIMTAVNYEYCFYWYLYQDGTVSFDMKLTGILSTSVLSPGEASPTHGTLVAPGVNAAAHQHLFSARLDLAVDDEHGGRNLLVTELNAQQQATDPTTNPMGNAFTCVETPLTSIKAAQREAAPQSNRCWRIMNPDRRHPFSGSPVSYHLLPAPGPLLLAQPGSPVAARAMFTTKTLMVTPYQEQQMYPAGYYVFQSSRDSGLAEWTKEDKTLIGADPVIWYTFGYTHFVRPEDYPVMPVDIVGFMLKPYGFFECNPALDLPPEVDDHSTQHKTAAAAGGSNCGACNSSSSSNSTTTGGFELRSRL